MLRLRAKRTFYFGLIALVLFEIARVYFIMPMPGSQRLRSLDAAYMLHRWRWVFRSASVLAMVVGLRSAFAVRWRWRWLPALSIVIAVGVGWAFNVVMTADGMFRQPEHLVMKPRAENQVGEDSLVVGIERNGEAKAYPIRFLVYHHQVRDTVGGLPVMVTYCSVCRTGRIFEPQIDGRLETFRLVGMDHFNAVFEDSRTGSWWRQATGKAVAGPLAGTQLPEVLSTQLTLRQFFTLHPNALVMQPDATFVVEYDAQGRFERGDSPGALTRTDRGSWQDKSWVIGIEIGGTSKAYDWNRLAAERVINDLIGVTPIVLALSEDGLGFVAFERPRDVAAFEIGHDLLTANGRSYDFSGHDVRGTASDLKRIPASQEFWHSWRSFHPETGQGR